MFRPEPEERKVQQTRIAYSDARAKAQRREQMRARIFKYDVEKGYGFLLEENNTRHFFHVTNCHGFVPQIGLVVTFQVGEGRRGPAALNIRLIPAAPVNPVASVATDTSAPITALAGDTSKSEVAE